jgi:hypothetical protein
LDVLGVPHDLMTRWTGRLGAALTDHDGAPPGAGPVP